MITGISASSASCRSAASTDQPSRSGIITSRVMAIGRSSLASFKPSKPPAGSDDGKPFGLQMMADQLARGRIVVDDQDAVRAGRPGGGRAPGSGYRRCRAAAR